jgi:hypothetical protein
MTWMSSACRYQGSATCFAVNEIRCPSGPKDGTLVVVNPCVNRRSRPPSTVTTWTSSAQSRPPQSCAAIYAIRSPCGPHEGAHRISSDGFAPFVSFRISAPSSSHTQMSLAPPRPERNARRSSLGAYRGSASNLSLGAGVSSVPSSRSNTRIWPSRVYVSLVPSAFQSNRPKRPDIRSSNVTRRSDAPISNR